MQCFFFQCKSSKTRRRTSVWCCNIRFDYLHMMRPNFTTFYYQFISLALSLSLTLSPSPPSLTLSLFRSFSLAYSLTHTTKKAQTHFRIREKDRNLFHSNFRDESEKKKTEKQKLTFSRRKKLYHRVRSLKRQKIKNSSNFIKKGPFEKSLHFPYEETLSVIT